MVALRWYQEKAIKIFGVQPEPRRFFLPWDMGAGKTLGAIAICKAFARQKVLIIAPALVRENWRRELQRHWPEATLGIIEWGRKRALPDKDDAIRTLAYAAPVQVVSYDLLKEVDPLGWDMIIVDEFHNLRSPRSVQSKNVWKIFRANPDAYALGLSGTPIPNEAKQLWNPVDTFFPDRWGKRTAIGAHSWQFLWKFCEVERNNHGTLFHGLKTDMRPVLESQFREISFRVVQKDFAEYLPPLFVEPLYFERKPNPVIKALEWYDSVRDECDHIGIYTHLRKTAREIAANLAEKHKVDVSLVIGAVGTAERNRILEETRHRKQSIVVGTTHALKEGISLSFQKAALVTEWTTAVDEIVQFIARFGRQDSKTNAPTVVKFVVGPDDEGKAEVLRRRMDSINSVIKASKTSEIAAEVFAEREMSDESFQEELDRLVQSQAKRSALWSPNEDDEDDSND